jgi:hypothetical protein
MRINPCNEEKPEQGKRVKKKKRYRVTIDVIWFQHAKSK